MKLVCLNAWGGKLRTEFDMFMRSHADADIFCFQEVFSDGTSGAYTDLKIGRENINPDLFQTIGSLLPDHKGIFCPVHDSIYGIAMFVRKSIPIVDSGEVILYRNDNIDWSDLSVDHTRKMQWARIVIDGKEITVMNLHGYHSKEKTDRPERLEQAKIINEFLGTLKTPYVLAGDFNMTLNTQSTAMIETKARNLVREYGATTTRTKLYTKTDPYADFIFTSADIDVQSFSVLPDLISDHCPLVVEFK